MEIDKKRSYIMSRIRKTDTKPEITVRKHLHNLGFRYRLYSNRLPGKPDIILPKYKTIIFVNGCFWHAHENCKLNKPPKTRTEYWLPKIARNVARDQANKQKLISLGWKVLTIWECEIRNNAKNCCLNKLADSITI